MIKVILWDIDGTLLNFEKAESVAIKKCFRLFHLGECTDEMVKRYAKINKYYWEQLELGVMSKQEILVERFRHFFLQEGILCNDIEAFNQEYQLRLSDTICFNDNGLELVTRLKGKVKQYAVTNGTLVAQTRKLELSGLKNILDGVFISDVIGVEKPNIEFFQYVWKHIGNYKKEEVLIVGDSLTSDMQGGNNAGILCCWYHKKNENSANHTKHIEYTKNAMGTNYEKHTKNAMGTNYEKHTKNAMDTNYEKYPPNAMHSKNVMHPNDTMYIKNREGISIDMEIDNLQQIEYLIENRG